MGWVSILFFFFSRIWWLLKIILPDPRWKQIMLIVESYEYFKGKKVYILILLDCETKFVRTAFHKICRYTKFMAQSEGSSTGKKLIQIDISSDTVCPWCFVGKRNLDKAIASSQDQFDFEVPFLCFCLLIS